MRAWAGRVADVVGEALAGLGARGVQAVMTGLGVAVGIGTLVATTSIAVTAGNQVVALVDAMAPTQIVAEVGQSRDPAVDVAVDWDQVDQVAAMNGVVAAVGHTEVTSAVRLARMPVAGREHIVSNVRVFAATEQVLAALGVELIEGRPFDRGHAERGDAVVLVSRAAAHALGLRPGTSGSAIFLNDEPLSVTGIFDGRGAVSDLANGIIVPVEVARRHVGSADLEGVIVRVQTGATELVARQLPVALFPIDPSAVQVRHGVLPTRLRGDLARDVNSLVLLVGTLALLVATMGITNTALVTVMERTAEIGLRRALGMSRSRIGTIFLAESALVGGAGAILGASCGIVATVVLAAARDWTPILQPWLPPAAVATGVVVGLLAGAYPAAKAMRVEPVTALVGRR